MDVQAFFECIDFFNRRSMIITPKELVPELAPDGLGAVTASKVKSPIDLHFVWVIWVPLPLGGCPPEPFPASKVPVITQWVLQAQILELMLSQTVVGRFP